MSPVIARTVPELQGRLQTSLSRLPVRGVDMTRLLGQHLGRTGSVTPDAAVAAQLNSSPKSGGTESAAMTARMPQR
jgi:hypothetical protein